MSMPGRPQGDLPDAGKPQLHDTAPPVWTGVPLERDPVSGRLLSGDPLGRGDKGRSARGTGRAALITAGAVALVAAVVLTLVLVTGGSDGDRERAAAAATTSPASTTTTPAVGTGPRDLSVDLTVTAVRPPPGFGPDPAYGTVGQVVASTWTLGGACDGTGACQVTYCQGPDRCTTPFTGEPEGNGYVARFSAPVAWGVPECTGGSVDNTVTWTMRGEGDDVVVSGSWVQQAAQVLFTGSDGRDCGVYLVDFAIGSP